MRNALRIGLLGASRIAPRAIVEPARERDDVEVSCVAARDVERARAYAVAHGIPGVAPDYDALLARDDVDIVYISLPPSEHLRWTMAALAAGKAALCEKPFAMNAQEAATMVETAKALRLPLIEAFHNRFHAAFRKVEELVALGRLGTLRTAAATFRLPLPAFPGDFRWQAALGGGALADLGCYAVHALRTLSGHEPQIISASMHPSDGVDAATRADCRFGPVAAKIECSMIAEKPDATLTLAGDRGVLTLVNYVAPQLGHLVTLREGDREIFSTQVAGRSSYAEQLEHVLAVMRGSTEPMTGGADAVATMTALDAIRAASRVGMCPCG